MRTRCCSSRLPGSRDSSSIRCGTCGWGSRSYAAGGPSRRAPTERLEGQQAVEETLVAAERDAQLFGRNGGRAGDFRLVPRLVRQTLLPALPVPLRHDRTSFYVAAQPTGPFATARGGGFPQAEPCLTKDAASPYGWSPRRIRASACHPRVTLTACVCSPSATWSMRPSAPPCPRARARSTW